MPETTNSPSGAKPAAPTGCAARCPGWWWTPSLRRSPTSWSSRRTATGSPGWCRSTWSRRRRPGVRLRCTLAAFDQLDPAEETQFVPGSVGYAAYGPQQVDHLALLRPQPRGGAARRRRSRAWPASRPRSPTTGSPSGKWRCGAATRSRPRTAGSGASRDWSSTLQRSSGDPCAAARGAPVGPQGRGHPHQGRVPGRGHHPAQHQQARGAGPAAGGLRPQPYGQPAASHGHPAGSMPAGAAPGRRRLSRSRGGSW